MRAIIPVWFGAVVVVAMACNGGDSQSPPEDTSPPADISEMVLQQEDVPAGLVQVDVDGRIENQGESGIQADLLTFLLTAEESGIPVRFSEFELPADEAKPGEVVCVSSFAMITDDSTEYGLGLFNFAELIGTSVDEPLVRSGDAEIEMMDPKLMVGGVPGGVAWRFSSPTEDLCDSYRDRRAEGYIFYLLNQNVSGASFVTTLEGEADPTEAVGLAQKQADRIESVLAND